MISFDFSSRSEVINLQTLALKMAREMGFSRSDSTKIAIAVSELATNCVKYADGGRLSFECGGDRIIVTVTDQGPGIKNLEMAFRDHCSDEKCLLDDDFNDHAGLGTGLPAVKRLMDVCEIEYTGKTGTRIRIEKHIKGILQDESLTMRSIDKRIRTNWAEMLTGR